MKKPCIISFFCIALALLLLNYSHVDAGDFKNPTGRGYRYYSQAFHDHDKVHPGIDMTGLSSLKKDTNNDGYIDSIGGEPAIASKDGKVIYADWESYKKDEKGNLFKDKNNNPIPDDKKGYGRVVIVDHEDGRLSVYGHLEGIYVKVGDRVRRIDDDVGTCVGPIDNTGWSTGNHLHFEIREYTQPINWGNTPGEILRNVLNRAKAVDPFDPDIRLSKKK